MRNLPALQVVEKAAPLLLLVGAGIVAYVIIRGPSKIAQDAGRGAVKVVDGAVTGVVDEVGKIVGLPSPADVTSDPFVARYMIDHPRGGYLRASAYATPLAMARALALDEFSGRMPPEGSRIKAEFPPDGGASGSW